MDRMKWSELLLRIGPQDADDIDEVLAPFDQRPPSAGKDLFPLPEAVLMPETALRRADMVCVGLRASGGGDVADRAMQVAAFAIEHDVEVVVLSEADYSGFERFGFRIERLSGDRPEQRAACEDQIRRFWNLDLVL